MWINAIFFMKKNKLFTYVLIVIGAFVAIYAQYCSDNKEVFLGLGVVVLLLGLMRLSRTIPSKKEEQSYIKSEDDDI